MMTNEYRRRLVLTITLLALMATIAVAQPRWGAGAMPRDGVCLFEDINMGGQYFCARPGEALGVLPAGMADRISSLRVIGRAEVTVFGATRFGGRAARFATDVRDLRRQGWNDRISSLRVSLVAGGWNGGGAPSWGNAPLPREGACFYTDAGFRGAHFCVPRGAGHALVPPGFNDHISSIRVMRATVMVFSDRDFGGRSSRFNADAASLERAGWNDVISSIRVF
jgi:hypothetical protein